MLDNCEHVVARASPTWSGRWWPMTADLRVLTTSRAPLGLSSESVYPLPRAGPGTTRRAVRASGPGRPGPASTCPPPRCAELCAHLDGLPLAVELAAARVRVMSVAEIARGLDDRFALLRGGPRDAPPRHHTLHAVIDWSWNLLDAAGRAAMRALSVFPGGFTAEAAGHVLGGDVVGRCWSSWPTSRC